jgi:cytochrome c oxidase assembly protein subunit 15
VIALQAVLGILTLLNQVPIELALAHQATAIAVLTLAVMQVERLAGRGAMKALPQAAMPVGQVG